MRVLLFSIFFLAYNLAYAQEKNNQKKGEAKISAQILEIAETDGEHTFKFPEVSAVEGLSPSDLQKLNAAMRKSVFGEQMYMGGTLKNMDSLSARDILAYLKYKAGKEEGLKHGINETGYNYEVLCNHKLVLSVRVAEEYTKPYVHRRLTYAAFYLGQGERNRRITLRDICKDDEAQEVIYDMLYLKMRARGRKKIKDENIQDAQIIEKLRNPPQGNVQGFIITDAGITFYSPFGFPYPILAAEPNSEYIFSWEELKDYVNQNGIVRYFYGK